MDQTLGLRVSEPGSDKFEDSIVIATGSTDSPGFKINCSGHEKIQFILPVLNEKTPDTEKMNALVDKGIWEEISIKRGELANARLEKKVSPLGVIEMSIIDKTLPAKAEFTLDYFRSLTDPGTAACYLRYQKRVVIDPDDPDDRGTLQWVDDPSTNVTIAKTKKIEHPLITSFKADRYIISTGETATISWKTDNSDYCLLTGSATINKDKELEPNGTISERIQLRDHPGFRLKACTKESDRIYDERELRIAVKGASVSEIFVFLPPNATLMGLYPHKNKLYAIVLHKTPQVKAYLYASESGLMDWQQVFRYPDQPVELDARLAGSPGIVFKNRLYLIGGSSFDPDKPGDDIGYYNFETKEWISSAQMVDKKFPTPRMGHTCVMYKDEIWLLGGYHPSKGTLKDIWTTKNGIAWTKAGVELPGNGRCMMGSTLYTNKDKEELWIFGGFKTEPGGEPYGYADTRKWDGNSWGSVLGWTVEAANAMKERDYKAFSLVSVKDNLFLFSTSRLSANLWEHTIFRIYDNNGWDLSNEKTINDWGMDQDGYSLQTTVYKSTVWIRSIRLAGRKDAGVTGKELYYYYYVPSK